MSKVLCWQSSYSRPSVCVLHGHLQVNMQGFVYLYVYRSVPLSICLSAHLSACLSVCVPVCLSVYLMRTCLPPLSHLVCVLQRIHSGKIPVLCHQELFRAVCNRSVSHRRHHVSHQHSCELYVAERHIQPLNTHFLFSSFSP